MFNQIYPHLSFGLFGLNLKLTWEAKPKTHYLFFFTFVVFLKTNKTAVCDFPNCSFTQPPPFQKNISRWGPSPFFQDDDETVGVEITMPMSAKAWMVVMTWKIVFTYHHHQVEQLLLPIRRESELWTLLQSSFLNVKTS